MKEDEHSHWNGMSGGLRPERLVVCAAYPASRESCEPQAASAWSLQIGLSGTRGICVGPAIVQLISILPVCSRSSVADGQIIICITHTIRSA